MTRNVHTQELKIQSFVAQTRIACWNNPFYESRRLLIVKPNKGQNAGTNLVSRFSHRMRNEIDTVPPTGDSIQYFPGRLPTRDWRCLKGSDDIRTTTRSILLTP